ncbi:MAG: signal peptidase I [Candidatus Shapirobacteria bacterium]
MFKFFARFFVTLIFLSLITLVIFNFFFKEQIVPISGTGSMYPTFPKHESTTKMMVYPSGVKLFDKTFFDYKIGHGDIVAFENEETKKNTKELYGKESGYIKRVIALPGDTIEIRDALIILNSSPLKEPYTALARSTFGGNFLSDCHSLKIPEGKLFVMGDNRKGSSDSRYELGLIDFKDISHVIPLSKQIGTLDKNWHDTTNDFKNSAKIKLDPQEYVDLLNQKRKEANLKELKYNPKLNKSAELRAQNIIKFDDFSFEATRSGYTIEKAVSDANYSNIVYGEVPTSGYYDAQELVDNYFQFASSKKFMLNKDYQDIGIATVEGSINGCPTQVIVQHLAGYFPPNYKKEDIQAWQNNLNNLKEVQTGWSSLKDKVDFYNNNKSDVDRLNQIISNRITNISAIVKKMSSNLWLSKPETDYTYQDRKLFEEQQSLSDKINNQIKNIR